MKDWTAQVDPPKEASTFERMDGRSQFLFSNKMTHYLIEWTTTSDFLRYINIYIYIIHTKTLMLQIDLLKSSCF